MKKEKLLLKLKRKLLSLGLITSTTLATLSGCSKEDPTRT